MDRSHADKYKGRLYVNIFAFVLISNIVIRLKFSFTSVIMFTIYILKVSQ